MYVRAYINVFDGRTYVRRHEAVWRGRWSVTSGARRERACDAASVRDVADQASTLPTLRTAAGGRGIPAGGGGRTGSQKPSCRQPTTWAATLCSGRNERTNAGGVERTGDRAHVWGGGRARCRCVVDEHVPAETQPQNLPTRSVSSSAASDGARYSRDRAALQRRDQ